MTTLIALNVIPATLCIAVGFGAVLLIFVLVGWRVATAIFDPQRLITNTK